jgi:8-oxo-dGTP diphosphatase
MHSYRYPRPSLSVDCVVFGFSPAVGLSVLLVTRKGDPFAGHLALPGGFVNVSDGPKQGESLEEAARRELMEETGVRPAHLEQLYTFGNPGRDPRGRVVSVAYLALVRSEEHDPVAGSDAAGAQWFPLKTAQASRLAFDHTEILAVATERLRAKVRYAPVGFGLLPREFTLAQLRALYEALLGEKIDPSNFAAKAKKTGVLAPTSKRQAGSHRPARLYRFDAAEYARLSKRGFNFEI